MVAALRPISAKDQRAAAELSKQHSFGAASEAYIICSEPVNGVLALNRESGRAVYDTTVGWAEDDRS